MDAKQCFSKKVYVVEVDDTPVATFSLNLQDEQRWGPQELIAGYGHGLSVRKGLNGRGLGGSILDWCAIKVSGLNRHYVRFNCPVHNSKLCAYYESLGFASVGLWATRTRWLCLVTVPFQRPHPPSSDVSDMPKLLNV
jgi:hypothetical protein